MTFDETNILLTLIDGVYGNFTKGKTDYEKSAMTKAWYIILGGYDGQAVKDAVIAYCSHGKYAPVPADIIQELTKATMPDTEDMLQELITQAEKSVLEKNEAVLLGYTEIDGKKIDLKGNRKVSRKEECFEALCEENKAFVRSPEGLQQFAEEYQSGASFACNRYRKEIVDVRQKMVAQQLTQSASKRIKGGKE